MKKKNIALIVIATILPASIAYGLAYSLSFSSFPSNDFLSKMDYDLLDKCPIEVKNTFEQLVDLSHYLNNYSFKNIANSLLAAYIFSLVNGALMFYAIRSNSKK